MKSRMEIKPRLRVQLLLENNSTRQPHKLPLGQHLPLVCGGFVLHNTKQVIQ